MPTEDEYPVYAQLSLEKLLQLGGDYFYEEDDQEFDSEFDCGFIPGEGCSMIGTEDCDFDCPYRDELMKHPAYPNVDLSTLDC
ncbi:hypothetical protein [Nostoc sp.]|uniref:hypothetical protein n=1 Tax=Nostoc sp. TaxID=1180 RepID=UPI002FF65208